MSVISMVRKPVGSDGRFAGTTLPEGALRVELAGDEPEGHDPVLLGRVEQPLPRSLTGRVVLEVDLVEPGERVADVGGVVDRKPSPTPGVDVGERPIREVRPFRRFEPRHGAEGNERAKRLVSRIRPSRARHVRGQGRSFGRVARRSSPRRRRGPGRWRRRPRRSGAPPTTTTSGPDRARGPRRPRRTGPRRPPRPRSRRRHRPRR